MARRTSSGPTAERFIDTTIDAIAAAGGSQNVNLRQISRRMGCAHTNAYNYFASFDDLLWAAFRRVLDDYGAYMTHDLDESQTPDEYLRRLITNLVTYPQTNPGLYRFIGSDPISAGEFPTGILETVVEMKEQLFGAFRRCAPDTDPMVVDEACNIVYAYIDGETFNLINERVVPGEDIAGRIVGNALRLFGLLTRED